MIRRSSVKTSLEDGLMRAFLDAASVADAGAFTRMMTDAAVLIVDADQGGGTFGRVRHLPGPVIGATTDRGVRCRSVATRRQEARHLRMRASIVNQR